MQKVRIKSRYTLLIFLVIALSMWHVMNYLDTSATLPVYRKNPANYTCLYPIQNLSRDDYGRLIDLKDFHFQIMANVCYSNPLLLILVHSAPDHFEQRRTIRETWGQARHGMKVIFMLGQVDSDTLEEKLQSENEIFRDFVRGNFMDAYKNMTYKHVMLLKYVVYHCPQAKYIFKADDDIFVNIDTMLDFLKGDLSPNGVSDLLLCWVFRYIKPIRDDSSRYYLTQKEFPDRTFPDYCSGPVIMYSPDVAFRLYNESQHSAYLSIDDVYLTGIMARKLNIKHTDIYKLILSPSVLNSTFHETEFRIPFLFGPYQLTTDQIRYLWNVTTRLSSISNTANQN